MKNKRTLYALTLVVFLLVIFAVVAVQKGFLFGGNVFLQTKVNKNLEQIGSVANFSCDSKGYWYADFDAGEELKFILKVPTGFIVERSTKKEHWSDALNANAETYYALHKATDYQASVDGNSREYSTEYRPPVTIEYKRLKDIDPKTPMDWERKFESSGVVAVDHGSVKDIMIDVKKGVKFTWHFIDNPSMKGTNYIVSNIERDPRYMVTIMATQSISTYDLNCMISSITFSKLTNPNLNYQE